jgi:hypothetical protein
MRLWRLRNALQGEADGDSGQFQDVPAQESSPPRCVLHFNSDGEKLQEDCGTCGAAVGSWFPILAAEKSRKGRWGAG